MRACLATRERHAFQIDVGTSSELECNVPPFDGGRLPIRLVTWPWTEWPTFDEAVFERDLDRIERWYRARGYYDAHVESAELNPRSAAQSDELPPVGAAGCDRRHGTQGCPLDIDIHVHEGEPVLVRTLTTTGQETLSPAIQRTVIDAVQLEVGARFDEALHDATKVHMVSALRESGYACAVVRGRVALDPDERIADVTYTMRPGEISNFRDVRVEVEGEVDDIPLDVVRAVSGIERGMRFAPSRVGAAQRAVYALGAFSSVEVEAVPVEVPSEATATSEPSSDSALGAAQDGELATDEDPQEPRSAAASGTCGRDVDVVIHVTAGRRIRYGFGAGLDSGNLTYLAAGTSTTSVPQWNVHLLARFEHRNLFGGLRRLRIEERPKISFQHTFPGVNDSDPTTNDAPRPGNELNFDFRQPAFLERMTTLNIAGRWDLGPDPNYGGYRHLFDIGASVQRPFFEGRISALLGAYGNMYRIIQRPPREDISNYALSYLHQYFLLDLRNSQQNTRKGFMFSAEVSEAGVAGFSTWTYIRAIGEVRAFVPLPYRITIAGRFLMGAMVILNSHGGLDPVSEHLGPTAYRLRGGGPTSHRGFTAGALGDSDASGTFRPIDGGLRKWEGSLEIRSRITESFGAVLFGDVGDVDRGQVASAGDPSTRAASFRFDQLHLTLGFGLRYFTIVGPLRLDFGFRIPGAQAVGGAQDLTLAHSMIRNGGVQGAVSITIGDAF